MANTSLNDNGLTEKQQTIYDYVRGNVARFGHFPTYQEISKACGVGTPPAVVHHLRALERKGFLLKTGNTRGRFSLVKRPAVTEGRLKGSKSKAMVYVGPDVSIEITNGEVTVHHPEYVDVTITK